MITHEIQQVVRLIGFLHTHYRNAVAELQWVVGGHLETIVLDLPGVNHELHVLAGPVRHASPWALRRRPKESVMDGDAAEGA